MYLELGDIIKLIAIQSPQFHNHIFLIHFFNSEKLTLVNISNNEHISFSILNNTLSESSIENIILIKRHEKKGFAAQHNLYQNVWVDLHFYINAPFSLTGLITNTEEDMIEITLYKDSYLSDEVIYIDFAYKGIPDDLPLKEIKIRESPTVSNTNISNDYPDIVNNFSNNILQQTLQIDNIIYHDNEQLDPIKITQLKSEDQRKFGLNIQINDLTDELLSSINRLTKTKLHEIHSIISKYKKLYTDFVINNSIEDFFDKWYYYNWLIPITINKPYLFTNDDTFSDEYQNIVHSIVQSSINQIIRNVTNPDNSLETLNTHINKFYSLTDNNHYHVNIYPFYPDTPTQFFSKNIQEGLTIKSDTISYSNDKTPSINSKKFEIVTHFSNEKTHLQSTVFLSNLLFIKKSNALPYVNILNKVLINDFPLYYYNSFDKNISIKNITDNPSINTNFDNFLKRNIYFKNTLSNTTPFSSYINQIKPDISLFINHILPKIPMNKLSFHNIIMKLLEYSIEERFLLDSHIKLIHEFVNNQIIKYKGYLLSLKSELPSTNIKQSELHKKYTKPLSSYDIDNEKISSSEIISSLLKRDNMNLFYFSLLSSLSNIIDISKFNTDDSNIPTFTLSKKCQKYFIAKQYHTIEQLYNDNEKDIYFDAKFDPTNYDLFSIDDLNDKKKCLDKLIDQYKFTALDAEYEYTSIVNKKRLVLPEHFASLYQDNDFKIFKRTNKHVWELTTQFQGLSGTNIFCNIQKDCFQINKNTCTDKANKLANFNQQHSFNISKLDSKIMASKEAFQTFISAKYTNSLHLVFQLNQLHYKLSTYQNDILYNLGLTYISQDLEYSPHYDILQNILSIDLYDLKYEYIIKFCNKYTRSSNLSLKSENPYWRYCVQTNTKLIPTFYFELAKAYNIYKNYSETLDIICRKQGTISDDGDKIIDVHSGHKIKDINLHDDFGDTDLVSSSIITNNFPPEPEIHNYHHLPIQQKYIKYIINIINAITKNMYISFAIETYDAIINNVSQTFNKTALFEKRNKLPKQHTEAAETTDLMYLTLGYLLIFIVSSIPILNPTKQYPGCIKSLDGWPVQDISNKSALQYLTCIAFKIKTSELPWKVLKLKIKNTKPTQDLVEQKISNYVNDYILPIPQIQKKINDKVKHLRKTPKNIPKNLNDPPKFLPIINKFHFSFNIATNFKNLSKIQLQSKLLFLSILLYYHLQRKFYEISDNSNTELFLDQLTIHYNTFDSIKSNNNDITSILNNIHTITKQLPNNNTLFSNNSYFPSTKFTLFSTVYNNSITQLLFYLQNLHIESINSEISHIFSKLPQTSIDFKQLEFNVHLQLFKHFHKPEFDENNQLIDKITNTLHSYGINLNKSLFNKILSQVISHKNISINIQKPLPLFKLYEYLNNTLSNLDSDSAEKDPHIVDILKHLLDKINLYINNETLDMKTINNLKDILSTHIDDYTNNIIDFIQKFSTYKHDKKLKITAFIRSMFSDVHVTNSIWKPIKESDHYPFNIFGSIQNESYFRSIQFIKNFIYSITKVIPSCILNEKNINSIPLPKHWELSSTHYADISNWYTKESSFMIKYYEISNNFKQILSQFDNISSHIETISLHFTSTSIPYFDNDLIFLTMQFITCYYLNKFILSTPQTPETIFLFADYLYEVFDLFGNNTFKNVIMSTEHIKSIVHKTKENEKDTITKRLQDMSKEQRQIDNEFKKYGIGFWSKGLDKSVRFYTKEDYDDDNLHIQEQMESNDFIANLYQDIFYKSSDDSNNINEDEIEANDLSNIPEDDAIHSDNEDL